MNSELISRNKGHIQMLEKSPLLNKTTISLIHYTKLIKLSPALNQSISHSTTLHDKNKFPITLGPKSYLLTVFSTNLKPLQNYQAFKTIPKNKTTSIKITPFMNKHDICYQTNLEVNKIRPAKVSTIKFQTYWQVRLQNPKISL